MVDRNVILTRVSKIRESVQRLVKLAVLSEKAFRADADACAIAERHLQVAIQSVIDIGNHVVADLDLPDTQARPGRLRAIRRCGTEADLEAMLESLRGLRVFVVGLVRTG